MLKDLIFVVLIYLIIGFSMLFILIIHYLDSLNFSFLASTNQSFCKVFNLFLILNYLFQSLIR
jgi:hypothetical protein